MKLALKKIASRALYYTGLTWLIRNLLPFRGIAVLAYHKVDMDKFSEQMKFLKKNYRVIPLKEIPALLEKNPRNTVAVTFDDGYMNTYLNAYPALKKNSIPSTVFLTTNYIGKPKLAWWDKIEYCILNTRVKKVRVGNKDFIITKTRHDTIDKVLEHVKAGGNPEIHVKDIARQTKVDISTVPEKYRFLTWEKVREMKGIVSFEAHTENHPILTHLSQKEIQKEVKGSKRKIEKELKGKVRFIAYPNGDFNDLVRQATKESGFDGAFSQVKGINRKWQDRYSYRRVGINVADDKYLLALKLTRLWLR